jgi:N-acylneuraminate cytidylyltransferase
LLTTSEVPIVWPGGATPRRPLPEQIDLLVLDFDGVLTDDRVLTLQDGTEGVLSTRGDGLGLELLRAVGVPVVVLSKETNAVVAARCRKLWLECRQAEEDKPSALRALAAERMVPLERVVFVGNDVNDVVCMQIVGCGIAVADAHPAVIRAADRVLARRGGRGAVRELCDQIVAGRAARRT